MVISAGPLTRVFTGVASRLGVHAVYLDTQKNLSVFAPRLPWFCGIAHTAITHPSSVATYLKNLFFYSLSLSSLLYAFSRKKGERKREGEKKKCLGRVTYLPIT